MAGAPRTAASEPRARRRIMWRRSWRMEPASPVSGVLVHPARPISRPRTPTRRSRVMARDLHLPARGASPTLSRTRATGDGSVHADGRLATENGERLYERATGHAAGLGPLWFVDAGRLFFAGQLTYNAMHQHGAPVFLAGIYGPFRLRI